MEQNPVLPNGQNQNPVQPPPQGGVNFWGKDDSWIKGLINTSCDQPRNEILIDKAWGSARSHSIRGLWYFTILWVCCKILENK